MLPTDGYETALGSLGLQLAIPAAMVALGLATLLNLAAGHLSEEVGRPGSLRFLHRLGIAVVIVPALGVSVMLAWGLGGGANAVATAGAMSILLSGSVPSLSWAPAMASPTGHPLAGAQDGGDR